MAVTALIVAAGKGERLGGGTPKQFRALAGIPVLRRAVTPFAEHPLVDDVIVVVPPGGEDDARRALGDVFPVQLVGGGDSRAQSVRNGLECVETDVVLVHDAARPFCPQEVIDRLIAALNGHEGAVPVMPVSDTLARGGATLGPGIDREDAVRIQTPQAFRTDALRRAYDAWTGDQPTDESTVVRAAGLEVATVDGAASLEKLTTAEEWHRAEAEHATKRITRTGMGFDVHAFAGEGPLTIGGLSIAHDRGLAGHSDADVALHAITDALLGAAGFGDIGQHFPPNDPQWKGAASDRFLRHAADHIRERGGTIDHIDCTIVGEEPRIGPHREAMRAQIASILGLHTSQVSVKATTTERLGFTGRREGLAAQAVATIRMEIAP